MTMSGGLGGPNRRADNASLYTGIMLLDKKKSKINLKKKKKQLKRPKQSRGPRLQVDINTHTPIYMVVWLCVDVYSFEYTDTRLSRAALPIREGALPRQLDDRVSDCRVS